MQLLGHSSPPDILVAGGGSAGCAAALAAWRLADLLSMQDDMGARKTGSLV